MDSEADIAKLYESGLSIRQIVAETGLPIGTVRWRLKTAGTKLRSHSDSAKLRIGRYTEDDRSSMATMYASGLSLRQVGEKFGTNMATISAVLKNRGVSLRSSQEGAILQGHTKRIVDRNSIPGMYMDGMGTPEIARRIGLSEGAVYSILSVRGVKLRGIAEGKRSENARKVSVRQTERVLAAAIKAEEAASRLPEPATGYRAALENPEWLAGELARKPAVTVGKELGCGAYAVRMAARRFDIELPFARCPRDVASSVNLGNVHRKGTRQSPEAKEKIRIAATGRSGSNLGRKFTDEHKEKIRASNLGKRHVMTPEGKETMRRVRASLVLPMKDSSIERKLQQEFGRRGIEIRTHVDLTGLPDVFIEPNICVFADGDYWHAPKFRQDNDRAVIRQADRRRISRVSVLGTRDQCRRTRLCGPNRFWKRNDGRFWRVCIIRNFKESAV